MADESLAKKIAASSNDAIIMLVEDGLRRTNEFRLPLGREQDCGGTRRAEIEDCMQKRGYEVNSESTVIGVSEGGKPVYVRDLIFRRK